jgi:hypothetical protein
MSFDPDDVAAGHMIRFRRSQTGSDRALAPVRASGDRVGRGTSRGTGTRLDVQSGLVRCALCSLGVQCRDPQAVDLLTVGVRLSLGCTGRYWDNTLAGRRDDKLIRKPSPVGLQSGSAQCRKQAAQEHGDRNGVRAGTGAAGGPPDRTAAVLELNP